jgi:hypothetical protein
VDVAAEVQQHSLFKPPPLQRQRQL